MIPMRLIVCQRTLPLAPRQIHVWEPPDYAIVYPRSRGLQPRQTEDPENQMQATELFEDTIEWLRRHYAGYRMPFLPVASG